MKNVNTITSEILETAIENFLERLCDGLYACSDSDCKTAEYELSEIEDLDKFQEGKEFYEEITEVNFKVKNHIKLESQIFIIFEFISK